MNKKINPGKMQFVDPIKLAETIQQLQEKKEVKNTSMTSPEIDLSCRDHSELNNPFFSV